MQNLKLSRPQILGDKHNGGKSVILNIDGRVEKPRPCNEVFTPKDLARVLMKNTSVYGRWCNGVVEVDHLILEEVDQLKIGDIPYFFRYLNSKTINYWNNGMVAAVRDATDTSFILPQLLKALRSSMLPSKINFTGQFMGTRLQSLFRKECRPKNGTWD